MASYRHLFFDLDRTLWDFEANAQETLHEAYDRFKLKGVGIPDHQSFVKTYKRINDEMWDAYRNGTLSKSELRSGRFYRALLAFDIDQRALSEEIGDYYILECPKKDRLFPGAHEVLEYLRKNYILHIITNGFEEAQQVKLSSSRLGDYFQEIVTSERAGVKKPDPGIFEFSLQASGADPTESLMIGDDPEVDLVGARNCGLHQVYFNPDQQDTHHEFTFEISDLRELKGIL